MASDDAISDGRLFGRLTNAGENATVRMAVSNGFTVWQLSLPEVGADELEDERASAEAHNHPLETSAGTTPKSAESAYRGPILKPSEAERRRRHEWGDPEIDDEPWVPCPICAESQDPQLGHRCDACEGRGIVHYRVVADY
jgi:hypothetical protein